jgi:hypothetical protein
MSHFYRTDAKHDGCRVSVCVSLGWIDCGPFLHGQWGGTHPYKCLYIYFSGFLSLIARVFCVLTLPWVSVQRGVCEDADTCSASGQTPVPGYCPGPSNIQCCVAGQPSGGGGCLAPSGSPCACTGIPPSNAYFLTSFSDASCACNGGEPCNSQGKSV